MADKAMIDRLAETPLFIMMSRETIEEIVDASDEEYYQKDEVIIREKDIGDTFYIILEGSVSVQIAAAEESSQKTVTTLHGDDTLHHQYEGDFFGEMALLDFAPRSATVSAAEPTTVLAISGETMTQVLRKNAKDHIIFLTNIGRIMSRRIRTTIRKI